MARERESGNEAEASLFGRREYIRATGTLTGLMGLSAISGETRASSSQTVVEGDSVTANHSWQEIRLSNSYSDPVVLAGPLSYEGPQPATPRLRNISSSGFELSVEEWVYLDGSHRFETVSYLVTDTGVNSLSDGASFVAGKLRTDHRWKSTSFDSSFSTTPIVFSQVQSVNGPQTVVPRLRNISRSGLDARVQEEEAQGLHRIEDIGYLAFEPKSGTLNGQPFEVNIQSSVDHTWQTIAFDETYRHPVFLAELQTHRGANTCSVRYRNLTNSSVEVKVEEESSADREIVHLAEDVGYLVLEGSTDSTSSGSTSDTSPIGRHGQLHVKGTNLCNEQGDPIQLTGMSTHGIQWKGWDDCITPTSLDALAEDWQSDLCRIAMYVQSDGYVTDPEGFTAEVNTIVEEVTARGMYALVDFHILDPGDPMENLENAKKFFGDIAIEHADKKNIIYEICNEPNGVDWETIKTYAEEVIPVIRQRDSVSPIVVGTRGWSSLGFADIGPDGPQEIIDNPIEADNIMYAYHFYAATHGEWEQKELDKAADKLPLFVTEWGSMETSGDGENDFESAERFLDVMAQNNISWANWNYSDDWRTSGVWEERTSEWLVDNLTTTGDWIRNQIRNS